MLSPLRAGVTHQRVFQDFQWPPRFFMKPPYLKRKVHKVQEGCIGMAVPLS
jgi:hypothetical protein